jgi:hypothetical protein
MNLCPIAPPYSTKNPCPISGNQILRCSFVPFVFFVVNHSVPARIITCAGLIALYFPSPTPTISTS